jgi:hypothetical protein
MGTIRWGDVAGLAGNVMNPVEKNIPDSLSNWLKIATRGLAANGKERIAREIEVHFAEAVEAHIAQGEPEPVAQARAIIALGNATLAAKRFRKKHFAESEAKTLAGMRTNTAKLRYLLLNLLPVLVFPLIFRLLGLSMHHIYFIGFMCVLVALPVLSFVIANLPPTKATLTRLLLIELASDVSCTVAIFSPIILTSGGLLAAFGGLGGAVVILPATVGQLHFWNKARKLLVGETEGAGDPKTCQ